MKRNRLALAVALFSLGLGACSNQDTAAVAPETASVETSTTVPAEKKTDEQTEATTSAVQTAAEKIPEGVAYQNIFFDHSAEIAAYQAKSTTFTTPKATVTALTVEASGGATGTMLVPSVVADKSSDYYLNTYVAGAELTFRGEIQSAYVAAGNGKKRELTVTDGAVSVTPKPVIAGEADDEIITIITTDGSEYRIHTIHELMAQLDITKNGETAAGAYSFAIDKFLIRLDTQGQILYYRNVGCIEAGMVENFKAQDTDEGRFYTYFAELKPSWRNVNGGYSSGMYVIMDENFKEIEYVTLMPNDDNNHTHGEGYLDQHEFVMLGKDHWLSLSYTPVYVENIPEGGIDGGNTGYVHAGIIQEVKDGAVIQEINTTDYEIFYRTAMECGDYETSTDQGTPDDTKDYVHVNSVAVDPKDNNLIVSMRHQYAVYKFDRTTGALLWTLGGQENEFSGLDDIVDENGNLFVGQHDAKYVDPAIAGNDSTITVFDNHTDFQKNLTRTIEFVLDEENKTATVSEVINGADLDGDSGKLHWATHCGSIIKHSKDSVLIGWGLHGIFDNNPEMASKHPVFSDYNPETGAVTFELCVNRNPLVESHEACFSYRTYKNAD